ncbi:MAG: methylenetetrahydrofolate--tRNA-(uracil(54)-C(5))-methyltransferase (FADH(2)-oxidizing) TrmFO [Candidatus Edwardsbacteria bacterium RIFOXYD12_FULL_50_11]|uniref:Methylenetetrahydrofolate--tRNA-(uracil-5-)-methyltransferase TrmFO n=1 Tax=Candidatus Edwardsbacteria bacterium GWF2_54_11 TaxID=1817851 RepID=A0A1F5R0W0_9BACT|nr:MAG: methylenetetrahydrofolate--tRNA-(uracil(54)-C(5))-methyltransferase (FADH(2)-oxidizing) TrmFO [Candidatus Edwardsbacteria bacterium RifOxyC12_full_54_24]OGF08086.1 MAG: methylenetetrahydrofolate--tRNA-(uracil(54)-C(5))-methyltransferase (FADH(2)-oxidizing) TrmFO [Candidatus Edwardsbacteria bacterium GWF2_54_11]OGF08637.1 MAG: methylenetetrahydrofolate--tRNA-(uracil(54)-C(5))-methyltransferase (FADH(2)-oxidizing) TrmFO [Candidatus Edwardsbacteria bacterium RifOxyA12_full_54_48]OGF11281.1 
MQIQADRITIIGGGLAGCEAAYQAVKRGLAVDLYEMRFAGPGARSEFRTPAHETGLLAELVCSNSLKSVERTNAHGLLKAELEMMDSLILRCARETAVPAGKALAVDRMEFARRVTDRIASDKNIKVIGREVTELPDGPLIVASGPLTSDEFAQSLARFAGGENLFFYDAIAPVVSAESLDHKKMFRASRYSDEPGQYWNCPLSKTQYLEFVEQLVRAERHLPHDFEKGHFYEGCLPVEVMAERNVNSLRFGMMKPVGLIDPAENRRPYAVLQLRQENRGGTTLNLVGFQTQLTQPEQRRIFRMIPALERAEFYRYGSIHRNTYLRSPGLIQSTMQSRSNDKIFFAGQITGVEGYVESAAMGLLAGINAGRYSAGKELVSAPEHTVTGSLARYVSDAEKGKDFQPMNANFGLLPPLDDPPRAKKERYVAYAERSLKVMEEFVGIVNR